MQNLLQNLQYQYNIYNPEIEPEHETEFYCGCPIHNYQRIKWNRYGVQEMWSKAVMYPGKSCSIIEITGFAAELLMRVVLLRREILQRQSYQWWNLIQQESIPRPYNWTLWLSRSLRILRRSETTARISRQMDPSSHQHEQQTQRRCSKQYRRARAHTQYMG